MKKHTMKKTISSLLAAALLLPLVGCGEKKPAPEPDPIADNYRTFY